MTIPADILRSLKLIGIFLTISTGLLYWMDHSQNPEVNFVGGLITGGLVVWLLTRYSGFLADTAHGVVPWLRRTVDGQVRLSDATLKRIWIIGGFVAFMFIFRL